jgi:hypothetical protein
MSHTPDVTNPSVDIVKWLETVVGDTGIVKSDAASLSIHIAHAAAFPWDEVCKSLLYRGYKLTVENIKAELFIIARK